MISSQMKQLSDRLREERRKRGLTQGDLAQLVGTTQQTISNIERGHSRSAREIVRIARALGVSADYLVGVQNEDFRDEVYELLVSLPPELRGDILKMLRTLANK